MLPGLKELAEVRADYLRDRVAFVEGSRMRNILSSLGARDDDLDSIPRAGDALPPDPTLPFRNSKNGRFIIDYLAAEVRRLEPQPFILTAGEDFVRHDSGQLRTFADIGDDLQANSALAALLLFNAFVTHGASVCERPGLNYSIDGWICTLFHLRTLSRPGLLGEPALEGIHSDGVDHTMTTFLGGSNLADGAAVTLLHDMRERNGIKQEESDAGLVKGRFQHRHFLDTLLIVDHELKHSVSAAEPRDPAKTATRDMLIFFTRKPATPTHPSRKYDSTKTHSIAPMSLSFPREMRSLMHLGGAGEA